MPPISRLPPTVTRTSPPLYFIRHGETDWNKQGLIQGWVDIPLNETGHSQARALGLALAAIPELAASHRFYVSPLERTRQTMSHIAAAMALPGTGVIVDHAVKELGFGVWEGKPFWELKASPVYPADPEARYDWRPQGGESYEDGHARARDWLAMQTDPVVVVAHGAIGRCLIGHLTNLDRRGLVGLRMPQGKYCRIENGRAEWFDAMRVAA